ncbi:MAG: adenylosuccinate synthetase [Bacteroidetes bacterium]|nr:adenylosuccinate synthetase [Bacteroidota bacterium]
MSAQLVSYVKFVENYLGLPVTCSSVGPDRKQMIQVQLTVIGTEAFLIPSTIFGFNNRQQIKK